MVVIIRNLEGISVVDGLITPIRKSRWKNTTGGKKLFSLKHADNMLKAVVNKLIDNVKAKSNCDWCRKSKIDNYVFFNFKRDF